MPNPKSQIPEARDLFPTTRTHAFLNHAAVAPFSKPVADAMQQNIAWRLDLGALGSMEEEDRPATHARRSAAELVGADEAEVCLTRNTSHGLNIVAAGLPWQPGDNLVTAQTEFPANVYPWRNLERKGVTVRFAPARDNRVLVDDVAALMDDRTRLVAISFVEFATGYRNDLVALADLCHTRGALLCVDGIQGVGALSLDVGQVPLDFLAVGGPKWVMGPIGTGFLFIRRQHFSTLDPAMAGWMGTTDSHEFFRYDLPWREDARRFEEGSLNRVGAAGLDAAIKLLLSVGLETIEQRIMALTDRLIEGLRQRGYRVISPVACQDERSGIVSFQHEQHDPEQLAQGLTEAKVVVSRRGMLIRVSPHFYNNEDDIDRLLSALP
jgi:cysteine desulfurase/selenocysteine lyase